MAGKSSGRWLQEHFSDAYVKRAQQEGYRSRAVYKLLEIQERDHLFKPGMTVVDLGAAPGGWAQLVVRLIKPRGRLIALDLLPMDPIEGVEFIQGDFSDEAVLASLLESLAIHADTEDSKREKIRQTGVDWVISDMAPNMSGNESVDIPRSMYLAELALDFALQTLQQEGGFLIKMFQGEGFDAFFAEIKSKFKRVVIRKPKASRDRSRELYILARGLKA